MRRHFAVGENILFCNALLTLCMMKQQIVRLQSLYFSPCSFNREVFGSDNNLPCPKQWYKFYSVCITDLCDTNLHYLLFSLPHVNILDSVYIFVLKYLSTPSSFFPSLLICPSPSLILSASLFSHVSFHSSHLSLYCIPQLIPLRQVCLRGRWRWWLLVTC